MNMRTRWSKSIVDVVCELPIIQAAPPLSLALPDVVAAAADSDAVQAADGAAGRGGGRGEGRFKYEIKKFHATSTFELT